MGTSIRAWRKFDKKRRLGKVMGATPGKNTGEFDTPHSIAADAKGNIYVADRGLTSGFRFFDPGRQVPAPRSNSTSRSLRTRVPGWVPIPSDATVGSQHAGFSLGHLHHTRPESSPVCRRRVPGPPVQAIAGRKDSRRPWPGRQTAQTIRLDSRNRLPHRKTKSMSLKS